MGDRFYQQMRDATGWCPGMPESMKTQRRRRVPWTDEAKAQAVEMYTAEEPTPENSMEVVKEIAAELGESPNGVRMILTKAGVYVKKTPAARSSSSGGGGGGGKYLLQTLNKPLKMQFLTLVWKQMMRLSAS